MPMLASRITIQKHRFIASVEAGVIRIPAHTERLQLNLPTLTEAAYEPGEEKRTGWKPMLSWRVGAQLPETRWNFEAVGRVLFGYQQNHWLGIGVGYML
jgi:hypothetical protein